MVYLLGEGERRNQANQAERGVTNLEALVPVLVHAVEWLGSLLDDLHPVVGHHHLERNKGKEGGRRWNAERNSDRDSEKETERKRKG